MQHPALASPAKSELPAYRRLVAETITAADGQPAAVRAQMWEQTALVLELLSFRKGWPGNLKEAPLSLSAAAGPPQQN
jgi:hypothetical protein